MVPSGAQVANAFTRFRELEPESTQIVQNQPLFVPGLLQVEGYATAVLTSITGLAAESDEVRERVAVRMGRARTFRKRLDGATPPSLRVILDESVLVRSFGGPAVMRQQLDHLVEMAHKYESVQLEILLMRDGGHAGLAGPFEIHWRSDDKVAVFLEVPKRPVIVEDDPVTVDWCIDAAARLSASAVKGDAAIAIVEKVSAAL